MRRLRYFAASIAFCLLVGGCASSGQRPEGPVCPALANSAPFAQSIGAMATRMHTKRAAADTRYVLALSGGGPWGAFGSGFLKGWSQSSAQPDRPDAFDVVTGVSTGALMATYAFLGRDYDEALVARYTNISDKDIFRPRPLLSLLWANSLATTKPLIASIEEMITPEVIKAVAAQGDLGRHLLVGAVNLDTGDFETFDLTRLAADYSERPEQTRACYVAALSASAAQPLAFPPTFINNAMYTDGGVRQTVFITNLQDALSQHAEEMQARMGRAPRYDISVVMNTDLRPDPGIDPTQKLANRLPAILQRTLPIVVDQTDQNGLELIQAAARIDPNVTMRWTSARDHDCAQFDADPINQEFKPKKMACLIRWGEFGIWEGTPWQ